MHTRLLTIFIYIFLCLILPLQASFAESNHLPIHQLNQFGKTLQVSSANEALNSLLTANPFYPDGPEYAMQLVQHYKSLISTVGKITHFTVTQERELAEHLHYLQCYTEHAEGGIILEFEFGLREQDWFLTKIYFARQ